MTVNFLNAKVHQANVITTAIFTENTWLENREELMETKKRPPLLSHAAPRALGTWEASVATLPRICPATYVAVAQDVNISNSQLFVQF